MARLKELNTYERLVMKKLSENQRIVDMILNTTHYNEADFLHYPIPNHDVKFTHIFPYNYVPDTQTDAQVFICYNIFAPRVFNKTYKTIDLTFYVLAEQSLIVLDDTTRLNAIAEEIDEMFNGTMEIGLNRMRLLSVEPPINPVGSYHGKVIRYTNEEWNR
jgi:hypothetical protein